MKKEYSEKVCCCTLNRLFGFRPDVVRGIIDTLGSAGELFNMSEFQLREHLGPFSKIAPMINQEELEASEEELRRLADIGVEFLAMADEGYPDLLRDCPDAPAGLYFKGASPADEVFNKRMQIAVVGTRDLSQYGREWCRKIVGAMSRAEHRPLIVSGFAIGADITAHLAALETGLPTVAVLPTGITDIYPPHNRQYVERMASTPGCAFVTDYPPGTAPKAINFIRRNRIIAGICSGTILIESKAKGGGMMTARLAASYNRDLLILPGRADDPRSQGCNQLLKEKLAEPIVDENGFLDLLGLGNGSRRKGPGLSGEIYDLFKDELTVDELSEMQRIAKLISRSRGISMEDICARTGLSFSKVSRHTGMMESEGLISVDLLQRCSVNVRIV